MRMVAVALACAAVAAVLPAPALAQAPANGQLAVVQKDRIVAVNPDGSALRTLYAPGSGDPITDPVWSPDGNKLAFVYQRKIAVLEVTTRASEFLTQPGPGEDRDPAWLADGTIGFRRASPGPPAKQETMRVNLRGDVGAPRRLDPDLSALALGSNLDTYAYRIGSLLAWTGPGLELSMFADGTPAWSPRGGELAYIELGSPLPPIPYQPGLRVVNVTNDGGNRLIVPPPVEAPRWAPAGDELTYVRGGEVMRVAARREAPTPVALPGIANATAVAWQPCVNGVTAACESVLSPVCSALTAQVTTQSGVPVELPAAPCSDPAGLPLRVVPDKDPEHGSLAGTVYTPRPGYIGQDTISYRVSNGKAQSDVVRVTVFVVPRPAPITPSGKPPLTSVAPYLSLRVKPKLDRKRTALARLSCDQRCTFTVRIEGRMKSRNRAIKGTRLKRTLEPGRILALRLKLPAKPKGTVKSVWITGTVQGADGASRTVKLPVTPRR